MKTQEANLKLTISATVIFLVGLALVAGGMLGVVSEKVAAGGSLLILVALLLRVVSFFRK
ncbi:MAG: hypothetical protein WKF74_14030 [Pyrinomonadaceae bacterium]